MKDLEGIDRIITVLMVEDMPSEQRSIMQAFFNKGLVSDLRLMTASNLADGMKILEKEKIDVLLLDLDLPDSKDLKSVSTMHRAYPDIPIVVLSGHSEDGIIMEALLIGAQEFLVKGECSGVMIQHTIRQAVARHQINKARQQNKLPEMV